MPRITEERREARREQILEAARVCVLERGLEAVSMEMIIARSGLSTGAVYRYFSGKDEIITATVVASMSEVGAVAARILSNPEPGTPVQLTERLLGAWVGYSHGGVGAADGIDRMPAALHGWSYALTEPGLRGAVQAALLSIKERLVPIIKRWQTDGLVAATTEPDAIAQLILSISLGFVAQRSLTGHADVQAHARALAALITAQPAKPEESGPPGVR